MAERKTQKGTNRPLSSSLVVLYKWFPLSCRLVIMRLSLRSEVGLLPAPHSIVFGGPLQAADEIEEEG